MSSTADPAVLLLSSNRRRRYAEDILTALALPPGSVIQFRYGSAYVAGGLQRLVADKSVLGKRALIAFVAEMDGPEEPFMLPVRFATVVQADVIADIFIFRLRVDRYANVDSFPMAEQAIRQHAVALFNKLKEMNGGTYFPAVTKFPDVDVAGGEDSAQLWLGVAQRLAAHPTFASCYFLRVDDPLRQGGQKIEFDSSGRLALTDQQSARIPVSFFSNEYSETSRKTLSCVTDGKFLRVSSDEEYDVALRYDTVEFWLQPSTLAFDAFARVALRVTYDPSSPGDPPATAVRFPVLVRRSRSRLVLRVASAAVGAFLVAFPAILGQGSSLALRIGSAVAGALLLAASTTLLSRVEGR